MYSVSAALSCAPGTSRYNNLPKAFSANRPYFGMALAEDAFSLQGISDPNAVADRLEALLSHENVLQSEDWAKFEAFKRKAEAEMGKPDPDVAREGGRILFERLEGKPHTEKQAKFIEAVKAYLYPPYGYVINGIASLVNARVTGNALLAQLKWLKDHARQTGKPEGTFADSCALFLIRFQPEGKEQEDAFRQVLEFYNTDREPQAPALAEQVSEKVRSLEASGFRASE